MRRAFSVLVAALGLAITWPVFLLAALAVKLEDRGRVFFRQERVGIGGRPFYIWKFRTMIADAERRGPQITTGTDPRVTRVGHWLRRTKLDELPQLLNVLTDDMNLVGPRPEVPRYVARYTALQRKVLDVPPGITDPSSLVFRRESDLLAGATDPEAMYVSEILPEKLRISMTYAARATLWSDAQVIFLTVALLVPHLDVHASRWLYRVVSPDAERRSAPRNVTHANPNES